MSFDKLEDPMSAAVNGDHPADPVPLAPVLLIDIGGTNIKWHLTTRQNRASYYQRLVEGPLQTVHRVKWERRLWRSLEEIVSPQAGKVAGIGVSITDHTAGDSREYKGYLREEGIPGNLAERLEHIAGLARGSVTIIHDTRAWARGYQSYLSLSQKGEIGPRGLIVVGTGVSFVKIDKGNVEYPELSSQPHNWETLNAIAGGKKKKVHRAPHEHLAKKFFEWMEQERWDETDQEKEILKRALVFLREISRVHGLRNFVFAGGYGVRFLDLETGYELSVLDRSIAFDPDHIPLMGLLTA